MTPEQIINEVKNSNLRGRGGAAFPTGMKWSFIPKESKKPVYVCCNADESEPGTFANRYQLEHDPHGIIEGILIACRAVGSHTCLRLFARRVLAAKTRSSSRAGEARAKGYIGADVMGSGFGVEIYTHRGSRRIHLRRGDRAAGIARRQARLSAQSSAVSRRSRAPSAAPPWSTMSRRSRNVPRIIKRGADWYKAIGPEKSPGTKLFCLSGHVNKPGFTNCRWAFR